MKMKYYVIGFHVTMCVILVTVLLKLTNLQYKTADVATYNGWMKEAEDRLNHAGIEIGARKAVRKQLEQEFQCNIIFSDEDGYMKQLYAAYGNGDTVFDYMEGERLAGKIIFRRTDETFHAARQQMMIVISSVIGLLIVLVDCLFFLLYRRVYAPFRQLQRFAFHIASGNLDLPLDMTKNNYFGAFTESFDIMREELKAAREGEARANRSKKELVASLSHDIKTPVATIKALCELLEIQEEEPVKVKKIHTIQQKANQIDQLISNMFHATLEELEALKIHLTAESSNIINDMLEDLDHYGKIEIETKIPSCLIVCDRLRLTQVMDNIIGNSYKYAGTRIHVRSWEDEKYLFLQVRDEGVQLDEVDVALVCEKYYRGGNAEQKDGSGLGLFLARQFLEGMGGSLSCSIEDGFVVNLALKKDGKWEDSI